MVVSRLLAIRQPLLHRGRGRLVISVCLADHVGVCHSVRIARIVHRLSLAGSKGRKSIDVRRLFAALNAATGPAGDHSLVITRWTIVATVVTLTFAGISAFLCYSATLLGFVSLHLSLTPALEDGIFLLCKSIQNVLRARQIHMAIFRHVTTHQGQVIAPDRNECIDGVLTDVKRRQMRQEIVTNEEAHKYPVIKRTL